MAIKRKVQRRLIDEHPRSPRSLQAKSLYEGKGNSKPVGPVSMAQKKAKGAAVNLSIKDMTQVARDLAKEAQKFDLDNLGSEHLIYGTKISKAKTLVAAHVDMRTHRARRMKEVYRTIINDLGGPDNTTEAQRALARGLMGFVVMLEELTVIMAQDPRLAAKTWFELCKNMTALCRAVGVSRQAKLIGGSTIDELDAHLRKS